MKQDDAEWKVNVKKLEEACQLALVEHKTLAEINGISSAELEEVYASGLDKYNQQKPEEAITDFTYLVMHQPWDRRFHMALGSTLHWLGEYTHAMNFYGYALVMDACDPGATFRIAQCFISLGDETAAIDALQTAITQSFTKPEHYDVGQHARKLLEELNK